MKNVATLLFAAFIIAGSSNAASGQRSSEQIRHFPQIPKRPAVSPTAKQLQTAASFEAAHMEWEVRLNVRSHTPRSLLGPPLQVTGDAPEEIARQFLAENRELLNMTADRSQLAVRRIERYEQTDHVSFQQEYLGIPIEGAIYGVHMRKNGGIYYAAGDYYDEVQVPVTAPSIARSSALTIAQKDLGPGLSLLGEPEGSLIILPYGNEFRLAWKVLLPAKEPRGRWIYYISASTGKILGGYNAADHTTDPTANHATGHVNVTAEGKVYDRHPEAGQPIVIRELNDLYNPGTMLEGGRVHVVNYSQSVAYETDSTFFYSPNNFHFKEVMLYYHIDEFATYMGYQVGHYCYNFGGGSCEQVLAVANDSMVPDNASAVYFPPGSQYPSTLYFGTGDGVNSNNWAMESSVIGHEYMHLTTEYLTVNGLNGGSGPNNQTRALDEGFSDFFGCMYADSPVFAEYVKIGPGGLRNLDNNYTMSDWDGQGVDSWPEYNYHQGSQIFSGALWEMRQQLGEGHANKAVFSGLRHLNYANPDFLDAREAILAYAYSISYSGKCTIKNIFASRGIGDPCSNPSFMVNNSPGTSGLMDEDTRAADGVRAAEQLLETYILAPNAPNPFTEQTTIRYGLPEAGHVTLVVYDVLGREVMRAVDDYKNAGTHRVTIRINDLPAGIYFYQLQARDFQKTRQMMVLK